VRNQFQKETIQSMLLRLKNFIKKEQILNKIIIISKIEVPLIEIAI